MLKTIAIGNLGKDCSVNNVNGKKVINFSVAHTEKYKDSQGENVEKTTWVDCSWWTESTKIVEYLKKGSQIYVEGFPSVKTFTRNDGSTGVAFSLRVLNVQLLGGSKSGQQESSGNTEQQPAAANTGVEDDLPF